jgi:hypothetical protein
MKSFKSIQISFLAPTQKLQMKVAELFAIAETQIKKNVFFFKKIPLKIKLY